MRYCRNERFSVVVMSLAALMILAPLPRMAWAGIFSKHSKPNPAERVPALIATLRSDAEERKRSSAAEELRQYDPALYPEIIPSLADAAQHDPKSGVRMEAITSLAKLRPVSQRAGAAIEQATHDDTMRVRMQARTLLWQYHLAGYHGSKTPDLSMPAGTIHTEEPPLAVLPDQAPVATIQKSVAPQPIVGYVSPAAPPTAQGNVWGSMTSPRPLPLQPAAVPLGPRAMPTGPTRVESSAPQPRAPSSPKVANNGPKPLPPGPVETVKPIGDGIPKETQAAPQKDDGPELP